MKNTNNHPIFLLDDSSKQFPQADLALADPNGLLAIGGDLSPKRLINAYQSGIFPWFSHNDPILWWSPDPRAVLFPERLKINRSLKRALKNHPFKVSHNQDFAQVIANCAAPRSTDTGTWITEEMQAAYIALHQHDIAHSFECWQDGVLVGGLYGIWIGDVFFAESMFRKTNNASKVALIYTIDYLTENDVKLIDIQIMSPHLLKIGAEEISRQDYLQYLKGYCPVT